MASFALAQLGLAVVAQAQTISFDADRLLFGAGPGVGARALAMGGAFIAVADDASAAFWNPAGLSRVERRQASLVWQPHATMETRFARLSSAGVSTSFNGSRHESSGGWSVADPHTRSATGRSLVFASLTIPFRIGRSRWASELSYNRVWDFGLRADDSTHGIGSSFMLGAFSEGPQQYSYGGESWQELSSRGSGGIDVVSASSGVAVTRRLRLGVAVNRWIGRPQHLVRSDSEQVGTLLRYRSTWTVATEERFSGMNVGLGALFEANQKLRAGVVFKSPFDLARKVERTFQASDAFDDRPAYSWAGREPDSDGRITYPLSIGAGIAFAPSGSLTVSADWTLTRWSKAGYEGRRSLGDVYLGDEAWDGHAWPTSTSRSSGGPAAQADARQLRAGAEYVVRRPRFARLQGLPVRVGVLLDRQPYTTLEQRDVDRLGLTAGLGLIWRRISVDVTYVNVRGHYKCCERELSSSNSGPSFVSQSLYRWAEDGDDRFRSQRFYLSSTVEF